MFFLEKKLLICGKMAIFARGFRPIYHKNAIQNFLIQ